MRNSLKMKVKRKSEQEKNDISTLVSSVIARINKHKATSYEISKNVDMTEPGIKKIINRITKYPNIDTLKEIDSYLKKTYESQTNVVNEKPATYESPASPDYKLIMDKLDTIIDKIERSSLRQEVIFEIIKNAKKEELIYMEKMIKEKLNS